MMKKLIFLFVLMSFGMAAQDTLPKMQLMHDGYKDMDSISDYIILEFPNKSKQELFDAALATLNTFYVSPKTVLSTNGNTSIVVEARDSGLETSEYTFSINYNISLQFKEGKIKMQPIITDMEKDFRNIKRKMYISDTDSPKEVEVNCVWMKNTHSETYYIYDDELKHLLDIWVNVYKLALVKGIKSQDW